MQATYPGEQGTIARAAEAMARVRDEIDQLWADSITKSDETAAERLVAVSHLIRSAYHLLDGPRIIG